MIVIWRNGQQIVITGWRAWLIGLPVMVVVALVGVALIFLLLGIALTFATLVAVVVPLAIGLTLLASWLQSLRAPPPR